MLADLLGDQEEVVDHVLGAAVELGPQVFALGRDPGRAGVQVALPRHVAAERDQHAGAETELLGAEHRRDDDVAAVAQATVCTQAHPLAQAVGDQHLLCLGEAELPRRACVLDRGQRRRAGATVVARDEDVVGAGLRNAGRDGADAGLGDKLHADPRPRVHRLQVVDQLRQVFDRVDVVVGRGRDELHAGLGMSEAGDQACDLDPGELAALARLRALRDLDLQLVGALQVARGDAEAGRGDLLDAVVMSHAVTVVVGVGVFAALARVGAGTDLVHRDGERLVRLR